MPQFKNREEYEKWKAEREKELEGKRRSEEELMVDKEKNDGLKDDRSHLNTKNEVTTPVEEEIEEEKHFRTYFKELKLINCPTCKSKISINAEACPKCGEPITEEIRQKEIKKVKNKNITWAIIISIVILLSLLGKYLPDSTTSTYKHHYVMSDTEKNTIISEFSNMSLESVEAFIYNINDFLSSIENKGTIQSFKETGNQQVDVILSSINFSIDKVNEEIINREKKYKNRLESLKEDEENLSDLAERMIYAPRGSEYLERLNSVREMIIDLELTINEPKSNLNDIKNNMMDVKKELNSDVEDIEKTKSNNQPETSELSFSEQAKTLKVKQDWQGLLNLAKNWTQAEPNNYKALHSLSDAYSRLGLHKKAIEIEKQIIKLKPDDTLTYHNLGFDYSKTEKYEDAIKAYKQAIRINPDDAGAHRKLAVDYFLLGRARKRVDANLVIKHLKEAIRINPDDAKAYHILGLLYQFLGQVLTVYRVDAKDALKQDAIDAFKQAIRIKPTYKDAHYQLGLAYLDTGQNNKAREEYQILKNLDSVKAKKLINKIGHSEGFQLPLKLKNFTNIKSQIEELCNEVMKKQLNDDSDEFREGCIEGYYSYNRKEKKPYYSPGSTSESYSSTQSTRKESKPYSSSTYESSSSRDIPSESAIKKLEKDEIRRKRDTLQPQLRELCLQGYDEACREYEKWEDLRRY